MRRHEIVAGVDFDEVVYPWYDRAHEVCELAGITGDCTRPLTWFPYDEYGCTKEDWLKALADATDSGFLYSASPMKGAVNALWKLYNVGAEIHIITARGGWPETADAVRAHTMEYLDRWDFPTDRVHFTPDKEAVARQLGVTHAIDDHLLNYQAFERAGALTWLHDQPWNMAPDFKVRRVSSLTEFVDTILEV